MGYHRLKFGITGSLSKKGGRSSVFTVYSDVFCPGGQFWLCSSRWRWRSNAHLGAWSTKWWRTCSSQEEGHGKCKGNQISLMTHDHESHEYSWIYRVLFHLFRTTGGLVITGNLTFSHWFASLHLPFPEHFTTAFQRTSAHSDILAYADGETLVQQSTRQFLEANGGWSDGARVWQGIADLGYLFLALSLACFVVRLDLMQVWRVPIIGGTWWHPSCIATWPTLEIFVVGASPQSLPTQVMSLLIEPLNKARVFQKICSPHGKAAKQLFSRAKMVESMCDPVIASIETG